MTPVLANINPVLANSKDRASEYILPFARISRIGIFMRSLLLYMNIYLIKLHANLKIIFINHDLLNKCLPVALNSLRSFIKICQNQNRRSYGCRACYMSTKLKSLNTTPPPLAVERW